jgi:hypothetical protein
MQRAYLDAGLMPADMEAPTYIRLKHLEDLIARGVLGADLRWTATAATSA